MNLNATVDSFILPNYVPESADEDVDDLCEYVVNTMTHAILVELISGREHSYYGDIGQNGIEDYLQDVVQCAIAGIIDSPMDDDGIDTMQAIILHKRDHVEKALYENLFYSHIHLFIYIENIFKQNRGKYDDYTLSRAPDRTVLRLTQRSNP